MFMKKQFSTSSRGNVQLANGSVRFQQVKLDVYTFFTDGVMIDTGAYSLQQYFVPYMETLPVEQVVVTHHHEDHTGNAFHFAKREVPIYMHERYIEQCTQKAQYPLYRKLFWGKRPKFTAEALADTFNSATCKWRVIYTPGHADDHVCFLNETTGQLFSGDLFLSPKPKVILREESVPTIIRSLEKVMALSFDEMYCNHAGYIQNGHDLLERKWTYLKELEQKVLMYNAQGKSIEEMNKLLFPKQYSIVKFSSGDWDSKHIIRSIVQDSTQNLGV